MMIKNAQNIYIYQYPAEPVAEVSTIQNLQDTNRKTVSEPFSRFRSVRHARASDQHSTRTTRARRLLTRSGTDAARAYRCYSHDTTWRDVRDMAWHDGTRHATTGLDVTCHDATWRDKTRRDVTWRNMNWHAVTWRAMRRTWRDMTWRDVTWQDVTRPDITRRDVTRRDMTRRHKTWHNKTWCYATWHDATWGDVTWQDVMLRDATWPEMPCDRHDVTCKTWPGLQKISRFGPPQSPGPYQRPKMTILY